MAKSIAGDMACRFKELLDAKLDYGPSSDYKSPYSGKFLIRCLDELNSVQAPPSSSPRNTTSSTYVCSSSGMDTRDRYSSSCVADREAAEHVQTRSAPPDNSRFDAI
ncbi:hypothetical protein QC764_0008830 [Podospora pseudoanserina]|uniref:Uncharacterized protein n=1 Tax=Podospora pseudoanserina TaxID=2609844 RepID=A0ABR0IM05_9PEZI|nr:hypothetical protein QC764_0008830 [Podospora pseudoanserina]